LAQQHPAHTQPQAAARTPGLCCCPGPWLPLLPLLLLLPLLPLLPLLLALLLLPLCFGTRW
jgi:hypothetical protein